MLKRFFFLRAIEKKKQQKFAFVHVCVNRCRAATCDAIKMTFFSWSFHSEHPQTTGDFRAACEFLFFSFYWSSLFFCLPNGNEQTNIKNHKNWCEFMTGEVSNLILMELLKLCVLTMRLSRSFFLFLLLLLSLAIYIICIRIYYYIDHLLCR